MSKFKIIKFGDFKLNESIYEDDITPVKLDSSNETNLSNMINLAENITGEEYESFENAINGLDDYLDNNNDYDVEKLHKNMSKQFLNLEKNDIVEEILKKIDNISDDIEDILDDIELYLDNNPDDKHIEDLYEVLDEIVEDLDELDDDDIELSEKKKKKKSNKRRKTKRNKRRKRRKRRKIRNKRRKLRYSFPYGVFYKRLYYPIFGPSFYYRPLHHHHIHDINTASSDETTNMNVDTNNNITD